MPAVLYDLQKNLRPAFLDAMRLVPGAVAIIATAYEGMRGGLAATAWSSLSADPPTMLACVNRNASAHDLIGRAGAFSINLLDADHIETAAIFSAQRGLSGTDRFLPDQWEAGAGGQPLFRKAVAAFECRLNDMHDTGSHSLLIGQVLEVRARPEGRPLLYREGTYAYAVAHEGVKA
ncbi:flavin reductase family protein [Sphingomonas sp. TREG-RG-20F-R18-01]|uniref:flavin reductase family protein n=1 Tax=Sphingomonas sp. TREG-RG-20F-R18-01 TaxID=2914982 RepID=UPI001F5A318A|nr:flavin reductase family protein [Sphingomonas sp. TREG-RG-20F-R18-01]